MDPELPTISQLLAARDATAQPPRRVTREREGGLGPVGFALDIQKESTGNSAADLCFVDWLGDICLLPDSRKHQTDSIRS